MFASRTKKDLDDAFVIFAGLASSLLGKTDGGLLKRELNINILEKYVPNDPRIHFIRS
jgi:hypothetical protein